MAQKRTKYYNNNTNLPEEMDLLLKFNTLSWDIDKTC
jgi:hypothetical protein